MTTSTTYKSATGRTVTAWIETECPNLADHNVTNKCYEFRVKVEGIGFGWHTPLGLVDGMFDLGVMHHNGKRMHLFVPASPEAVALYETYRAEVDRRHAIWLKEETEYQKHYDRIAKAMAE